jgi:signal transduction histidine kinase/CheY-like chemotaxis protein/ligand-binding sensor domain-containing protein
MLTGHPYKKVFFFLLFFAAGAKAQQPLFTAGVHYGVEEGLPQSYVSGIAQDRDGFMWFSTLDGLSRYDGRTFVNFRYRPKDTAGLSGNAIYYLLPQPDNTATMIYDGVTVDEFDLRTYTTRKTRALERLQTLPGAVWKLHNWNNFYNGKDWVFFLKGYKGIGWINRASGTIRYARKANGLLQQDTLSALLQAPDGRLFLVSEDGVHVSDGAKRRFTFFPFRTTIPPMDLPAEAPGFLATRPATLLPGDRLALYDRERIVVLHPASRTVHTYPVPPPTRASVAEEDPALKTDGQGRLYFKHAGRVFRMTSGGKMELLWENNLAPHLYISAFYIDRSDVLWVSVNAQGLVKVDLQALPFRSYRYMSSFVTDVLRQAGVPAGRIPSAWSAPLISYYFRTAYDAKGRLYASCNYYNGTLVHRFEKGVFTALSQPLPVSGYSALAVSPRAEVAAFGAHPAARYLWRTNAAPPLVTPLDSSLFKGVELADARVIGGYYWLSTYSNGLLQLREMELVGRYEGRQPGGIMTKDLTEICPDPTDKERFWIGSRGGGLVLWHVRTGLQKVYTTDDGLPNNTIYCILPGVGGTIWCSTNKGIFRLNPRSGEVRSFDKGDGLTSNEFNRAHKFLFPDGRIAFGGLEGYTIFNPADFETPRKVADVPVQLTALHINNKIQDHRAGGSMIRQPLSALTMLELPYDKNYLRLEFAALQYNHPSRTRYRYRLAGADKEWIESGTNNVAAYAGLPPGSYTFQVSATDNNGLWSPAVRELSITIYPPFWASTWAYLLYGLLVLVLLRMYLRFRVKKLQAEQLLAFERRESLRLREIEEAKERFFSNITHEFRTPLTLILTPLEKLLSDPSLPEPAQRLVTTAQKSSRQLLRLINEFLDLTKLDSGQMRVKPSAGDLALFITDTVQPFEAAAREKAIHLSLVVKGIEGLYGFDEEKWEKILSNLLSNALKFTPVNGSMSVSAEGLEEHRVRLQVSNTGPGISPAQGEKIFDRFYQADDSTLRRQGGTGIGLALVKELTGLLGGSIRLSSIPGKETTFTVELPADRVNGSPATLSSEKNPDLVRPEVKKAGEGAPLVLIVEDNDELRHFLVESLEGQYRVLQASDGLEAWERIVLELPDLVISDVMMPGRDGFDLCAQVKTDMRTAHILFMLLTSKAAHEARLQGLQNSANDYLTKPFSLSELELRAATLLQQQEKTRWHLKSRLLPATPPDSPPEVQDEFLKKLYAELDARLDDPELGVDYLCRFMAMSRSTLNRKLKSLVDTPTAELIRQYRLQKAAVLLTTGLDIGQVAYRVGFSSPSYFTQSFREQYGMTPSEYLSQKRPV